MKNKTNILFMILGLLGVPVAWTQTQESAVIFYDDGAHPGDNAPSPEFFMGWNGSVPSDNDESTNLLGSPTIGRYNSEPGKEELRSFSEEYWLWMNMPMQMNFQGGDNRLNKMFLSVDSLEYLLDDVSANGVSADGKEKLKTILSESDLTATKLKFEGVETYSTEGSLEADKVIKFKNEYKRSGITLSDTISTPTTKIIQTNKITGDSSYIRSLNELTGVTDEFVSTPFKTVLRTNMASNVMEETIIEPGKITVSTLITTPKWKIPDYVFEDAYELKSLSEVEEFINTNKHLPEIPSAKLIEKNGMNLTQMNILLLKKVEELTLHAIEMNKKIESQERRYLELKDLINER